MGIEVFVYSYRGPVAAGYELKAIVESCKRGEREGRATVELGLAEAVYECRGSEACVKLGPREVCIDVDAKVKDNYVYVLAGNGISPVALWSEGFVKLKPLGGRKPPTVEINGIHMHRIEGIDPYTDAQLKIRAARVCRGCTVLDTCMGLGYTAIMAARRAALVVTVEVDDKILWVAQRNPWSSRLASRNIIIVRGDVTRVIEEFEDNVFDRIIHDPPRFSIAPSLYTNEFYTELYRRLRPGGIMYHYTGSPGRRRGVNLPRTVMEKLRATGFTEVRYIEEVQGVVARKPRT